MTAQGNVVVQRYQCPDCEGDLVLERQTWECVDCGHVPRHAAD
ncbi:hypothetical protein [Natrinema sp. DC36]|nr:hypothetical protein [Natrinema sp. DC36]